MMSLIDILEAVLFVADAPADERKLASALGVTEGQVAQALEILEARLAERGAIQLVKIAGGYQLCTKPEYAESVAKFLQPQQRRLGRATLEVLAIVAKNQPTIIAEVDAVRGVQSDYAIRQLIDRGLIRESGRKQTPGRPALYSTTENFLHQFGLNSLSEIPWGEPVPQVQ